VALSAASSLGDTAGFSAVSGGARVGMISDHHDPPKCGSRIASSSCPFLQPWSLSNGAIKRRGRPCLPRRIGPGTSIKERSARPCMQRRGVVQRRPSVTARSIGSVCCACNRADLCRSALWKPWVELPGGFSGTEVSIVVPRFEGAAPRT